MSFHIEGRKGPFKVGVWLTGNPGKPNKEKGKEKFQIDHELFGLRAYQKFIQNTYNSIEKTV